MMFLFTPSITLHVHQHYGHFLSSMKGKRWTSSVPLPDAGLLERNLQVIQLVNKERSALILVCGLMRMFRLRTTTAGLNMLFKIVYAAR